MKRGAGGFTLTELLIGMLLLSVMSLAVISLYVTAQRFLNSLVFNNNNVLRPLMAMETMSRRIQIANDLRFTAGDQIKIRIDPNLTPNNTNDDLWVKYGIIADRLRWRQDATETTDVTASDNELEPNLQLDTSSNFSLANPTGGGTAPIVVTIRLVTPNTTGTLSTLLTSSALGAMNKN